MSHFMTANEIAKRNADAKAKFDKAAEGSYHSASRSNSGRLRHIYTPSNQKNYHNPLTFSNPSSRAELPTKPIGNHGGKRKTRKQTRSKTYMKLAYKYTIRKARKMRKH